MPSAWLAWPRSAIVDAIGELADIISLVAQADASADAALADAVWEAGAVAIGWGPSEPLEAGQAARPSRSGGRCARPARQRLDKQGNPISR